MAGLWMFGLPVKNVYPALKYLSDLGFKGIVLPVPGSVELTPAFKEYGLNVHLCVKAFALEKEEFKDSRYCTQDIFGRPRIWFGSGCPNNWELRERSLERVRDSLKIPNVDGILLDGIRFASPGEGLETFFTCFCESCKEKTGKMGYEFFALKDSVLNFYKSISSAFGSASMELLGNTEERISEWIRSRCECSLETWAKNLS